MSALLHIELNRYSTCHRGTHIVYYYLRPAVQELGSPQRETCSEGHVHLITTRGPENKFIYSVITKSSMQP